VSNTGSMKYDGPSKQVGQARDTNSRNLASLRPRMGVAGTDNKEDQMSLDAADFVRDARKIAYVIIGYGQKMCLIELHRSLQ
jgi:hypothetical protein